MLLTHPDGTHIPATLRRGRTDGFVVIAGATGVPQGYYTHVAQFLVERLGVNVLSLDYRGVGRARPQELDGFDADYRTWASELEVAIDHAADRGPTVVLGHSFGGHAFGMTPAHRRTLGMYVFAAGAGWHGHMPWGESMKVWALWHLVAPPLVATHGYMPFGRIGMGEDLPLGVYRDWKRWCSWPNYFFDDPEAEFTEEFDRVEVPVVGVNSTDDAWAPPKSARAFLSHYPDVELHTVDPVDIGVKSIGHLHYVRPRCQRLWSPMAGWLGARLDAAAA